MTRPNLIYSGGGNPRFYRIALKHGFEYGARLPDTVYGKLFFADQNWKSPNRELYMSYLKKHKPKFGTVLDLEFKEQLSEILDWGDEISRYVQHIIIIPKVKGIIKSLPSEINGKQIVLAYSVPTKYGGTEVPIQEFKNWPVHLLGGSPHKQIKLWREMSEFCDIISVDGNYFRMKATRFCEYWVAPGKWIPDGNKTKKNAHYACFKKSCFNIMEHWESLTGRL